MPVPRTTRSRRGRRNQARLSLVLAAVVTLSGCSGSGHDSRATKSTTPAVATTAPTTEPSATAPATPSGATSSRTPASSAPSASVEVTASAGPRRPVPITRAVHMTALAWSYKPKHDAVMALLKAHRINAIEVDIKDEEGIVGYASTVPLAKTVGAATNYYDVKKMIAEVHAAGGRVIGREVVFHDPLLGKWAWNNGHRDEVIQTTDHQPWQGTYGAFAFTNFASPAVQQYNIDLAVEAAKDGFDDVLFDYVRRPDGPVSGMDFPGLVGTPEQGVASFVENTRKAFTAAGVSTYLGASVFGISATRPKEIGQDISLMAPYLDYVAPMVYPSHWGTDEYGIHDPNTEPYEIVQRSLKDFQAKVKGTGATVVPWLQAFSLGVTYGPAQVLAQEKGAHDDGLSSFLLWNANADYDAADLPPMS